MYYDLIILKAFFCWDLFAKWKVANSLDGFRLEKICPCIIFSTRFRFCFQRTSGWIVLCLLVKLRGKGWGIGWNQVEESWTIKNQIKSPNLDKTDPAKMDPYIKIQIDPNTIYKNSILTFSLNVWCDPQFFLPRAQQKI